MKIEGGRGEIHNIANLQILPYSRRELPSVALSPLAGGSNAISTEDPQAANAIERFFLITADLDPRSNGIVAMHGRSGWLRMSLPHKPIAAQSWRAIQQFFQRRYKL